MFNCFKFRRIEVVFLIFFVLLCTSAVSAQVNTEVFRGTEHRDGFYFTTNFSLGLTEGNIREFNLRGNVRLDHYKDQNHAFAITQYSRGVQDGDLFRNAGFLALRNTYNFRPAVGWEVFAQQQFDDFLRLRDRKLAGTGLRFRLVNYASDSDDDNALRLHFGAGAMYEYEDINAVAPEKNRLIRSTNYASLFWALSDRINLNTVSYFQFDIANPSDFRNLLDTTLEVRLSRMLSLTFMIHYRYDSDPPEEVRPFDLEIQNGLRLAI